MPASPDLRELVIQRAGNRCGYCTIHQDHDRMLRFPIDRAIAGQHGGAYSPENTALARPHCNGKKGPNIASVVPSKTGPPIPLFNPRADEWSEHFRFAGPMLIGLTPVGEATLAPLAMYAEERLELRAALGYGA